MKKLLILLVLIFVLATVLTIMASAETITEDIISSNPNGDKYNDSVADEVLFGTKFFDTATGELILTRDESCNAILVFSSGKSLFSI